MSPPFFPVAPQKLPEPPQALCRLQKKPTVAAVPTPAPTPAAPMPEVTKHVPSYLKKYPWLSSYRIQSNNNNIHFAFDKSILTPLDKLVLRKDAIYLKYNPNVAIQIQGNCDRRGSEAYNLALGFRRANAAKVYLEDLGISSGRLKTISYGKERPLCRAHTSLCYAMNRRDHFVAVSR